MTQIEENDGYKNAFTLVIAAVLGRNYRFLRKSRVVLNTQRRSAGGGKERQTEGGDSNLGHLWWADRAALHLSCYSILHRRSPNDQTNDIDLTDTMMYRIMVSHRRAGEDTVVRYSRNKDRDSQGEDEKEQSAEGKARKKIWENYLSVL